MFLDVDFGLSGTDCKLPRHLFQIQTVSLHARFSYLQKQSLLQPVAKRDTLFFLCVLCQAQSNQTGEYNLSDQWMSNA